MLAAVGSACQFSLRRSRAPSARPSLPGASDLLRSPRQPGLCRLAFLRSARRSSGICSPVLLRRPGEQIPSASPALRSNNRFPLAPYRARTQCPVRSLSQALTPAAAQRGRAQLASYPHRHPNRVCAPSVSLAASVGTNISIRKADIVSGVEMMPAFSFCALLSDIPPAMSECVYPECCYSLWNIIMLSGISSFIAEYCYSLRNILIPDGISSCSSEYPYSRKNILILTGIELFAIRISIFQYEYNYSNWNIFIRPGIFRLHLLSGNCRIVLCNHVFHR